MHYFELKQHIKTQIDLDRKMIENHNYYYKKAIQKLHHAIITNNDTKIERYQLSLNVITQIRTRQSQLLKQDLSNISRLIS